MADHGRHAARRSNGSLDSDGGHVHRRDRHTGRGRRSIGSIAVARAVRAQCDAGEASLGRAQPVAAVDSRRAAAPSHARRCTPARERDQPPEGGFGRDIFVRFIRRARVIAGSSYTSTPCSSRCGQLAHDGIMDLATRIDLGHGTFGSDGGSGETAAAIEQGQGVGTGPQVSAAKAAPQGRSTSS